MYVGWLMKKKEKKKWMEKFVIALAKEKYLQTGKRESVSEGERDRVQFHREQV